MWWSRWFYYSTAIEFVSSRDPIRKKKQFWTGITHPLPPSCGQCGIFGQNRILLVNSRPMMMPMMMSIIMPMMMPMMMSMMMPMMTPMMMPMMIDADVNFDYDQDVGVLLSRLMHNSPPSPLLSNAQIQKVLYHSQSYNPIRFSKIQHFRAAKKGSFCKQFCKFASNFLPWIPWGMGVA